MTEKKTAHFYTDGEDWIVAYSLEEAEQHAREQFGEDHVNPDYGAVYEQVPDGDAIECDIMETFDSADLKKIREFNHLPDKGFRVGVKVKAGEWAQALADAGQVPSIPMSSNY